GFFFKKKKNNLIFGHYKKKANKGQGTSSSIGCSSSSGNTTSCSFQMYVQEGYSSNRLQLKCDNGNDQACARTFYHCGDFYERSCAMVYANDQWTCLGNCPTETTTTAAATTTQSGAKNRIGEDYSTTLSETSTSQASAEVSNESVSSVLHWSIPTIILVAIIIGLLLLVALLFGILIVFWRRMHRRSQVVDGVLYNSDGEPLMYGIHPENISTNLYGALGYGDDDPYNDLRVQA
ncbi:hypothetical protein RFI_27998, partial [Reticulomyxa filosa]